MLTFKLMYHSSLNLTSYIRHNCFYWQQVGKATLHVLKITKIQGDTFDKFGKKITLIFFIITYVRVGVEWFKMLCTKHFISFRFTGIPFTCFRFACFNFASINCACFCFAGTRVFAVRAFSSRAFASLVFGVRVYGSHILASSVFFPHVFICD